MQTSEIRLPWRWARFAAACGTISVLLASCASFEDRTETYLQRDLTSVGLADAMGRSRDFKPNAFPLASSMRGRRCGDVVGDTEPAPEGRARREPLQSSMAMITDGALRGIVRSYTFDRQMRQASIRHDLCYEHGRSTFGKDRQDCDADFLADAIRLCPTVNQWLFRPTCYGRAALAYGAVRLLGGLFSAVKMSKSCEYENALGPARDAVLAGRFLNATRDSLAYIRPDSSDALAVAVDDLSQTGIRIRLSEIRLATSPTSLPTDPELWTLSLYDLGMRPQDFLHYAPQIIDIDGDGVEEIILVGIHRWSREDLASGGLGLIFMVVSPVDGANAQALLGTYLRPDKNGRSRCGPHTFSSRWCLSEVEMISTIEILRYAFVPMPAIDRPGQRLAQIGFNTSQSNAVTLRSYDFIRRGDTIMLATTRINGVKNDWSPGRFLTEAEQAQCNPGDEYYRLFQYPALRFGQELVTWFRDRCEDIGYYDVKAQPSLIGVSFDLAGELNDEIRGKPVHIPNWPKAAIPMLPMTADQDAAKGVWAIYLSDRYGQPDNEIIKLRIRKGSFAAPNEAIYQISPPQDFTSDIPNIRQGELDQYFQYPLFSGFVRDRAHEAAASAMILFHITDQPEESGKRPDEDRSKWRLLTIAEGGTGLPAIREHSCPTPQHADLRRDRKGMVLVPYRADGDDSGTSFAVVVRSIDRGLNLSRIIQDQNGNWSVDGKACMPLSARWMTEQLDLKKAVRRASAP